MALYGEQGEISLLASHAHNPYNVQQVIQHVWHKPLDAGIEMLHAHVCMYVAHKDILYDYTQSTRFVRLCRQLHFFITRLYADVDTNSLVYSVGRVSQTLNKVSPMLGYWKSVDADACQKFYALYFSAASRLLVAHIQIAYESIETYQYASNYSQVEQYIGELIRIKKVLIGSVYERQCARQLSRYHELVVLLHGVYKQSRDICNE